MKNLEESKSNLQKKLASIFSVNDEFVKGVISHCDAIQEKYKNYGVVSVGLFYGYENGYNIRVAIKSGDNGPEWHSMTQLYSFNRYLAEDIESIESIIKHYSEINLDNATFNRL